MATGYVHEAYEASAVGNETVTPTPSTKVLYTPALSVAANLNPSPLMRDDEIRNTDQPLMVLPEHYAPDWSIETRMYPDSLGFRLKHILGAPTTTQGDGSAVVDPDSASIPAACYRHVWSAPFGPAGASPLTTTMKLAYADQGVYYNVKGAACQTMSISVPETGGGRITASGPANYLDDVADPSLSPSYESLAIPPFLRRHATLTWLTGSATTEDVNVTITNPVTAYRSYGGGSAYPDLMEKGEEPISFTGSIPKRQLDIDDWNALVAATGFAATLKWSSTAVIASAYTYKLWIVFDNAQYVAGGPSPLVNQRRIGSSFDFKGTFDGAGASVTVTLVNATTSYS